jgi:succinyl-CoA synthetase alpha subunit
MINIHQIRTTNQKILAVGSHPGILQSMLDFDYLSEKEKPSIVAVVANGRKFERYFFGKKEVLIPVYVSLDAIPEKTKQEITLFLNLTSARRVLTSTKELFEKLPNLVGGSIFAENTPERHSLELYQLAESQGKFIVGPSSVGFLIPRKIKLGAIGGVDARQFLGSHIFTPGSVAVFSASGGMTNEFINVVAKSGKRLSFSLSFGGDRFPIVSPKDAFLAAEADPDTKTIVYFGELGGTDEYDIVELLQTKKVTKRVIAYIAGEVSELFENPPQFGHAKAMAKTDIETARSKRQALKDAGAQAASSFTEFVSLIEAIEDVSDKSGEEKYSTMVSEMNDRQKSLITTSISKDEQGVVKILGEDLLNMAKNKSFGSIVASLFLGKKDASKELEEFIDFVLRLLVEHGPYVSGAVNTIVTSRAGRDLVSSLSAGLLTIGPRFGGAINQAAANWLMGVGSAKSPSEFVEDFASRKVYISGIGHRKYRVDLPDPRVKELLKFADGLEHNKYTSFALEVEKVTASKKGNLILNVDGTIAAVLMDILSEKEGYTEEQLKELTDIEFFNALFVLSRSVGFIAHFLDQKRLDEGLFRLEEDMVVSVESD